MNYMYRYYSAIIENNTNLLVVNIFMNQPFIGPEVSKEIASTEKCCRHFFFY